MAGWPRPPAFDRIKNFDHHDQGWSHNSLSGQVEFASSFSDLHFRIGAIEIYSYGCFELVASYIFKTGGSDDMPP